MYEKSRRPTRAIAGRPFCRTGRDGSVLRELHRHGADLALHHRAVLVLRIPVEGTLHFSVDLAAHAELIQHHREDLATVPGAAPALAGPHATHEHLHRVSMVAGWLNLDPHCEVPPVGTASLDVGLEAVKQRQRFPPFLLEHHQLDRIARHTTPPLSVWCMHTATVLSFRQCALCMWSRCFPQSHEQRIHHAGMFLGLYFYTIIVFYRRYIEYNIVIQKNTRME